jgi:two-component system KDP operon response regulator KdpE
MRCKILAIDDDVEWLMLLQAGLALGGFTVITATGGREGLDKFRETRPDLVTLDIMMPGMDGWATYTRLRSISNKPVIFLSALASGQDILKGLALGAADYLTKPCGFAKLKSRILAALGRSGQRSGNAWQMTTDDGSLRIDLRDGTVVRREEAVSLTPTGSRLLVYLASRRGQVISHKELLTNVWGPEYVEQENYLNVYVRYLCYKIEDDPSRPHYIHASWNAGYYFAA